LSGTLAALALGLSEVSAVGIILATFIMAILALAFDDSTNGATANARDPRNE
jgi:hypothetical protein